VNAVSKADVEALRARIAAIEVSRRQVREVLPFGVEALDSRLR
jgi:hypothetical protein